MVEANLNNTSMFKFITSTLLMSLALIPSFLFGYNNVTTPEASTTNPPTITLNQTNPYILEVGTPYNEPRTTTF